MINLNLILDGNFLLRKNLSSLWKNKILYSELYNILEKDFNLLTRLFQFQKIYFVSDSTSNWRKDFYPEYKGTRKKDEDIDWKFVYEQYNELKLAIAGKKIVDQLQINRMEGDDIMAYLVKNLNKRGDSTLVVSSDSDLYELVTYDGLDLKYINIMYNYKYNDERVFLPEQYKMFINNKAKTFEEDIFQTNNEMEFVQFFENFISGKKVIEINSEFELFRKIMGHGKDNIKSIFIQGNRGIGEAGIKTVYDLYKSTYPNTIDFNSQVFQNNLLDIIKFYKKLDNSYDTEITERLKRNLRIAKLDEKSTPKDLYEVMKNTIKL
jgi:5'-3' exonuclease